MVDQVVNNTSRTRYVVFEGASTWKAWPYSDGWTVRDDHGNLVLGPEQQRIISAIEEHISAGKCDQPAK